MLRIPLVLVLLAPSFAAAQSAGPDAFGHVATAIPPAFEPIRGVGQPGPTSDDGTLVWELPFAFDFYGQAWSHIVVGSNGGLSFSNGDDAAISFSNGCLPDPDIDPHVAVFWDDLNPSAGGGVWILDDSAANDRVIVSWEGVPHFGDQGEGSFQVHLLVGGLIEIHHLDTLFADPAYDLGASATVGIQDPAGGDGLNIGCFEPLLDSAWRIAPCADGDGDGSCSPFDCDGGDPSVHPGAPEVCDDGIDQDCDGADAGTDVDGDGYFSIACAAGDDCDDGDPDVWPAAPEVCGNGVDDDCDGGTPDVFDGDGDGSPCTADCDDDDPERFPGQIEVCADGIDNDCDGVVQGGDMDLDGEVGVLCGGADCRDDDPAATSATDGDGDGSTICDDCDDDDSAVHPGAPELCDGLDDDCDGDGDDLSDGDGDGVTVCAGDCDDGAAGVRPGAWEVCDGVDTDCDGVVDDRDLDGDGWSGCGPDCDDGDGDVFPGADELCDGVDQDCDGVVDSGDPSAGGTNLLAPSTAPVTLDASVTGTALWSSTVDVVAFDLLSSVEVVLDVQHPYVGDLGFTLWSPAGTAVDLLLWRGGSGDDLRGTLLADGGAPLSGGSAPFSGRFDPEEPLAAFFGEDPNGAWTLEVIDDFPGSDDGVLLGWSLLLTVGGEDLDGDGVVDACGDCDDADPTVGQGLPEVCDDGIDQDCSGDDLPSDADGDGDPSLLCGGGDCDDEDALVGDATDIDNDGFTACDDCDDGDPAVHPGAPEAACGVDANCDGIVEGDLTDDDGDGLSGCEGDCDDGDDSVHPGQPEVCGGGDEDCSGALDDLDADGDGASACVDDCDDGNPLARPGALESCDGVDQDCDGLEDVFDPDVLGDDLDGDGFVDICGDCDDTDPDRNPGLTEICGDGVDQDCDGLDPLLDGDGDGALNAACQGEDCDDSNPAVRPDGGEVCGDGLDNDCDPATADLFDGDGDGSDCSLDCDDADPWASPLRFELCLDGVDNDCDPATPDAVDRDGDGSDCSADCDDTLPWVLPGGVELLCSGFDDDCDPATPDVADVDGDGYACDLDCDETDPLVHPGVLELHCDGVDDDCDPSTVSDPDGDGDGDACNIDCDDGDPTRGPSLPELCADGIDNDCSPLTTDLGDFDGDGVTCTADCDESDPTVHPGAPERCADGVDQDCDGEADELETESFELSDDGSVTLSLCSFAFPFCGEDWDEVTLQANGRLTFGFSNHGSIPSAVGLTGQTPQLAPFWTNLDPSDGGSVLVTEDAGASFTVTFQDVPVKNQPTAVNSFDLILWPDGTATFDYGNVDAEVGLVGWSCGDQDVFAVDLSDVDPLPNTYGVGSGTEDAIYEHFDGPSHVADVSGLELEFCLTAGVDGDGDGWTGLCGDCDDADGGTFPTAAELCDGADHDCDGTVDDLDADGDGHVAADCGGDDCDDGDAAVHPDAPELCNGVDDDCSGAPETVETDGDGDGYLLCVDDCDDADPTSHPGAEEVCDSADNDCDGETDEGFFNDLDQDGFISAACGGPDCDDTRRLVNPDAEETCNGTDDDCSGVIDDRDDDGDTYIARACGGDDCADANPEIHPGADDVPGNGIDEDCSGSDATADEGDDDDSAGDEPDVGVTCEGCAADVSGGGGLLLLPWLLLRRRRPRVGAV